MSPASKDSAAKSSGQTTTCPWCSATVPVEAVTCPSCGASLREATDGDVPGVTRIDPEAVARVRRVKPRGVAAWLAGERPVDDESGGKVEPPSEAVRQEMLNLELAALRAEIDAKTQQAKAQQVAAQADAAGAGAAPEARREAEPDGEPEGGDPGAKSG